MAKWPDTSVYTPIKNINKGNEYQEADGLTAADMNAIVENIDYLYNNGGGTGGGGNVDDVQVNGQSIVENKVANIVVDTQLNAQSSNPVANSLLAAQFAALGTSFMGHTNDKNNPHSVTKSQVGLGNVDNTSDADKPVSSKQAVAIDAVEDQIILHKDNKSNPHAVTKAQVGLGNVDNTSDASKPISTAQQAALDALVNKIEITDIDLTFSDETVLYETTSGIQLSATGKITRKDGTSEQPQIDLDIPIVSGNGITIDKVAGKEQIEIKINTTIVALKSDLTSYAKTSDLTNYVKTATLNTILENYVKTATLNTTLEDYVKTTDLAPYAKTVDVVEKSQVGAASGVASLGADGKVPAGQLPTIDNYSKFVEVNLQNSNVVLTYSDTTGITITSTGSMKHANDVIDTPANTMKIPIVAGNNMYAIKSGNLVVFAARDQVGVGTTLPSGNSPEKIFIKTDENYEGGGGGGGSTGGSTYRHLLRCSDYKGTKEYKIAVYSSKSDTITTDYVIANPSCLVGAISSVLDNTQGTVTFDRLITGTNQGPPGYFGIEAGGAVPSAAFLKIDSDSFAAL